MQCLRKKDGSVDPSGSGPVGPEERAGGRVASRALGTLACVYRRLKALLRLSVISIYLAPFGAENAYNEL